MRRNVLILLALFAIAITVLGSPALIGSTYATTENQINTSGAKFQLTQGLDTPKVINHGSQDPIFYYENWEPGYTQLEYFTLTCETAEASFHYSFQITANPQQQARLTKLANVIQVYALVTNSTLGSDRDAALSQMQYIGTLAEVMSATSPMIGGSSQSGTVTFAVALHMDPSAGNDYQRLSLLSDPSATFHVTVAAQTN